MQKQTKKFLYEHTHYNKLLNLCVWDYNFDLVVVKHYSVAEENKEKLIHTHSLCICKKRIFWKSIIFAMMKYGVSVYGACVL